MSPDAPGGRTPPADGAEMSSEAVHSFLAASGDGVLSLSGDPPLSVPMSFAVGADDRLLFQNLAGPDSETAGRLRDGLGASLVCYERTTPDDWASVVVTGDLVAVDRTHERQAAFAEQAAPVGMTVFAAEAADLDAQWYELAPSSATGRAGPNWERPDTPEKTG